MSPLELAGSIFSGLHIGLTVVAISVAIAVLIFIVYRFVRTR
jgi:hypothetical protein